LSYDKVGGLEIGERLLRKQIVTMQQCQQADAKERCRLPE
jgi:hypothetical protein